MKNNGFTLVELLAVISILGIVSIFLIPTMIDTYSNSKKMIKKYDLDGIKDAAIMYATDVDLDVSEYTLLSDTVIDGKKYRANTKISGYEFKRYAIDNEGVDITMYDLVNGGYYDKNCVWAGTVLEDGEGRKIEVKEDRDCSMPKTCTVKVKIIGEKNSKTGYWITKDYKAEIADGCIKK